MEAIGRTFKPLWKAQNGFHIRVVGSHTILFVFEVESDAERVLAMEPWTFDKHLVLLQKYDGSCPVRQLQFSKIKFWIQLHGLPVSKLNWKTAMEVGKSVGSVSHSENRGDMIGGDFLRVRVEVDVSKPLCRGRKVLLEGDKEGWVSFKYEKMPNFCYWCGMVTHGDKECSVWLASKGSLEVEQQELGLGLHHSHQVEKLSWQLKVGVTCLEQKHQWQTRRVKEFRRAAEHHR